MNRRSILRMNSKSVALLVSVLATSAVLASGCSSNEPAEPAPATTSVAVYSSPTDQEFARAVNERFGIVILGIDGPKYQALACNEPDPTKAGIAVAMFDKRLTIKQGKDVAATARSIYCP